MGECRWPRPAGQGEARPHRVLRDKHGRIPRLGSRNGSPRGEGAGDFSVIRASAAILDCARGSSPSHRRSGFSGLGSRRRARDATARRASHCRAPRDRRRPRRAEAQRLLVTDHAVVVEAALVRTRRLLDDAKRVGGTLPAAVEAPHREARRPAAVGDAHLQVRARVEDAAEDQHRDDDRVLDDDARLLKRP